MDMLLPSEEKIRRSAKDTGKVHRVRYGTKYELLEDGPENLEKAPISWLQGLTNGDGGEIVEVPGKRKRGLLAITSNAATNTISFDCANYL